MMNSSNDYNILPQEFIIFELFTPTDPNASYQYNLLAIKIHFYAILVSSVLGTVGNSISSAIYLNKKFQKKAFGTYFAAQSIAQIICLIATLVWSIQPSLWPQTLLFCQITHSLTVVPQFVISWLQVLNSIDRVVLLSFAKRALFMRKLKIQLLFIFGVVVLAAGFYVPNLLRYEQSYVESLNMDVCKARETTEHFYYFLVTSFVYLLLPFAIMLACSIRMGFILRKSANNVRLTSDQRRKRDNSLTLTLLVTNIYFLITLLPFCIVGVLSAYLRLFQSEFFTQIEGYVHLIYMIFLSLIEFYYATTFFVHLASNSLFRQIIAKFFNRFIRFKIRFIPISCIKLSFSCGKSKS